MQKFKSEIKKELENSISGAIVDFKNTVVHAEMQSLMFGETYNLSLNEMCEYLQEQNTGIALNNLKILYTSLEFKDYSRNIKMEYMLNDEIYSIVTYHPFAGINKIDDIPRAIYRYETGPRLISISEV